MKKIILYIKPEEWLALCFVFLFSGLNIFVYHYEYSVGKVLHLMARYFTFGDPIYGAFFAFVWLLFFGRLYFFLVKLFQRKIFKREPFSWADLKEFLCFSGSYFRSFVPLILIPIVSYQFIAQISYHLRYGAIDQVFFEWDNKIFGGQAFIFLPGLFDSAAATHLLARIYANLPVAISLAMMAVYLKSPRGLFRRLVATYIFSILIGMPLFYTFPCQDPNNYFLKNIRNYSFSPNVSAQLSQYHPNDLTKKLTGNISDAETEDDADNTVPVSCFPSMHATWSLLVVFFMALVWRPSLFVSIPWIAILLTGGLYLAQHYAVDYLVAIPVALASIALGWILIKPKEAAAVAEV